MVLTLSYAEHDGYLMDVFNNYYEKGSFMDVQFVCKGNKTTFAHKLIVASVSSLVRKLISEMTCRDELMTIYLPDVNCNILNLLLTFLYEGVMKLDAAELQAFKDVCNLLCVELPNAEISEMSRETVSPITVPPPLALRLERVSSHSKTRRGVSKKPVIQSTRTMTKQTVDVVVQELNYQSVVVKQENEDMPRQPDNQSVANADFNSTVQKKQEIEKQPSIVTSGTQMNDSQTNFQVVRDGETSREPPDISQDNTAGNDATCLAISNVVSLSGGPVRRSQGQKRTKAPPTSSKPKKKAKQSHLPKK